MNAPLLGYLFLGFGITLPAATVYVINRQERERAWCKVAGRVVTARVDYDGEYYIPRIEYTYSYQGREHHGQTVRSFRLLSNLRGPAELICARYPVGTCVEVFVDPENPRQALLEPGGGGALVPVTLVGAFVFVTLGLIWLW
jgi:hypothetical protein